MATGVTSYMDVVSGSFVLRVNYKETYDITSNSSTISITSADLMSTSYSGYTYYSHGYIKVNGVEVANFNSTLGTHSYYLTSKNTFYGITTSSNGVAPPWTSGSITHNDDGSKSITIEVYVNLWRTSSGAGSGTNLSGSHTAVLTTIPRKSTLSVANGTLGTAQTLTVTRKSTSFTHTITATCGSASTTVCTKSSSTSISFTPPLSWASQNTTGTSVSVKYTITTYNGSTSVGSNSYTVSCEIPSSVKPSVSISVSDAMGYASTYGGYIKGLSKFKIVLTPTTSYSSPIASYKVTANGSTYTSSSVTTDVIKSSGTLTISASVTDKRGRSGSASTTVTVLNYSAPSISLLKVNRCNSDGTENAQGEYVKVTYSGSVTSLSNKNTAQWVLYYRKSSDSSYTSTTLSSGTTFTMSSATKIIAADTGSSYDIKLSVTDKFTTASKETVASTAFTLMHFNTAGNSMAIGKVAENENLFDVGLITRLRETLLMEYAKFIFMKTSDGTDLGVMGITNENELIINWDGYSAKLGMTSIYGNKLNLVSNTETRFGGGPVYIGNKIQIWTCSEGGNFALWSPNGIEWQMDAYDDNFRLYRNNNGSYIFPLAIGSTDGVVYFNMGIINRGNTYADQLNQQCGFLIMNSTTNAYRLGLYGYAKATSTNNACIFFDNTNSRGIWHYDAVNNIFAIDSAKLSIKDMTLGTGNISWNGGGHITSPSSQMLYIGASSAVGYRTILGVRESNWTFSPESNAYVRLGSPNYRWGQVYSSSSSISTSDRNLKTNIAELMDKHIKFFMMLQPVSFQFIDGTSGRTHIGFISQDVEEAMKTCGLSDLDFAGFCKDQKYERVKKIREVEKEVEVSKEVEVERIDDETGETHIETEIISEIQTVVEEVEEFEDVPIEGEYIYSLRYEEFIALNTHVIQKQQSEIETLKDEIAKIKAAIGL